MQKATVPTDQQIADISIETLSDLRSAGLDPHQIYRLQQLRDCLRSYPRLEYFTNDQWCRLLFMKWRYDNGEYAADMPAAPSKARAGKKTR